MNTGVVQLEVAAGAGAVTARIYYDPATQNLTDGPRGYCLDLTNTTGSNRKVEVTAPTGAAQRLTVGQGNPVKNRSLTAAQLKVFGFSTRADAGGFTING